MAKKTVLVHLGERKRPVNFQGGKEQLILAIKECFEDSLVMKQNQPLILQVRPCALYKTPIWHVHV